MRAVSFCASCGGAPPGRRVLRAMRAEDLRQLRPWARRYDAIRVEFLHGEERRSVEETIERDYLACGCSAGRVAFGVTLVGLSVTALAFRETLVAYPTELAVGGGLLVLTGVTAGTMLVALALARHRVNSAVNRLLGPPA
jgi:hypothetical protein